MPIYNVLAPDGRYYKLNGPEGADEARLQAALAELKPESQTPANPQSGFFPAMRAGLENIKGDIAALTGRAGLMDPAKAEQYIREKEAEAARIHKAPEQNWIDAPVSNLLDLAGSSTPYMAGLAAAGALTPIAGVAAPVSMGLGAALEGAQFTGSNLRAQMKAQNKGLQDTDLQSAALAAVPQTAFDVIGFRYVPGVRSLLGEAGVKLSDAEAQALVQQNLKQVALDYAKKTGQAMTAEGLAEAGQQYFERLQAGLTTDDAAARQDYLEQFLGGAALAGIMGPLGRAHERSEIRAQAADATQAAQAQQAQEAAAAQQAQEEQAAAARADQLANHDYARQVAQQHADATQQYQELVEKAKQAKQAAQTPEEKALAKGLKQQADAFKKDVLAQHEAELQQVLPTLQQAQEQDAAKQALAQQQAIEQQWQSMGISPDAHPYDLYQKIQALQGQHNETVQAAMDAAAKGDAQGAQQHEQALAQIRQNLGLLQAAYAKNPMPRQVKRSQLVQNLKRAQQSYSRAITTDEAAEIKESARQKFAEAKKALDDHDAATQELGERDALTQGQQVTQTGVDPMAEIAAQQDEGREPTAVPLLGHQIDQGRQAAQAQRARVEQEVAGIRGQRERSAQPEYAASAVNDARNSRFLDAADERRVDQETAAQPDLFTEQQEGLSGVQTSGKQMQARRSQLQFALDQAKRDKNYDEVRRLVTELRSLTAAGKSPNQQQAAQLYRRQRELSNQRSRIETEIKALAQPMEQQAEMQASERTNKLAEDLAAAQGSGNDVLIAHLQRALASSRAQDEMAARPQGLMKSRQRRAAELQTALQKIQAEQSSLSRRLQEYEGPEEEMRRGAEATARATRPHRIGTTNRLPEAGEGQIPENGLPAGRQSRTLRDEEMQRESTDEELQEALQQSNNPLAGRVLDNFDAVMRDPEAAPLVREMLHKERIGAPAEDAHAALNDRLNLLEQATSQSPGPKQRQLEGIPEIATEFNTAEGFQQFLASDAIDNLRRMVGPVVVSVHQVSKLVQPLRAAAKEIEHQITGLVKLMNRTQEQVSGRLTKAQAAHDAAMERLNALHAEVSDKIKDAVKAQQEADAKVAKAQGTVQKAEATIREHTAKFASGTEAGKRLASAAKAHDAALEQYNSTAAALDAAMDNEEAQPTGRIEALLNGLGEADEALQKAAAEFNAANTDPLVKRHLSTLNLLNANLKRAQDRLAESKEQEGLAQAAVDAARVAVERSPEMAQRMLKAKQELLAAQRALTLARNVQNTKARENTELQKQIDTLGEKRRELDKQANEIEHGPEIAAQKEKIEAQRQAGAEEVQKRKQAEEASRAASRESQALLERLGQMAGLRNKNGQRSAMHTQAAKLQERLKKLQEAAADETRSESARANSRSELKQVESDARILIGLLDGSGVVHDSENEESAKDALVARLKQAREKVEHHKGLVAENATESRRGELKDARTRAKQLQEMLAAATLGNSVERIGNNTEHLGNLLEASARLEDARAKAEEDLRTAEGTGDKEALDAAQRKLQHLDRIGEEISKGMEDVIGSQEEAEDVPKAKPGDRTTPRGRSVTTRKIGVGTSKVAETPAKRRINERAALTPFASPEMKDAVAKVDHLEELQRRVNAALEKATEEKDTAKVEKYREQLDRLGRAKQRADAALAEVARKEAPAKPAAETGKVKVKKNGVRPQKLAYQGPLTAAERASRDARLKKIDKPRTTPREVSQVIDDTEETPEDNFDYENAVDRLNKHFRGDEDTSQQREGAARDHTPVHESVARALRNGDLSGAIYALAEHSANPDIRHWASRIAPFLKDTKVQIVPELKHKGVDVGGLYDPATNTVYLHKDALFDEDALHEATHAATDYVLKSPVESLTPVQREARADLERMHKAVEGNPKFAGEHIPNVREFVAETLSNPQFREKLQALGGSNNLWTRFMNIVRKMFGLPPKPSLAAAQDAIGKILANSREMKVEAAPSQARSQQRSAYEGVIARRVPFREQLRADMNGMLRKFAEAAEMSVVDMRSPLIKAISKAPEKLYRQAEYYIREMDNSMSHLYAALTHGPLQLVKDSKGYHMLQAGNGPSAKDVFDAVSRIPGSDVRQKMDDATMYMVGRRAQNPNVGWDKLGFDPTRVAAIRDAYNARIKELEADPATKQALDEVARIYGEYNKGLIDGLAQSGFISNERAKELTQHGDYVPFYRVTRSGVAQMVLNDAQSIKIGDIRTNKQLHELKGGDQKILPLDESLIMNTRTITDLMQRNLAQKEVAYTMQALGKEAGKMRIHSGDGPTTPDTIRFKGDRTADNPEGNYWVKLDFDETPLEGMDQDLVAKSMDGAFAPMPAIVKGASWFGDILRSGVTRNPIYALHQLIRDPMAASFTGGLEAGPVTAVAKAVREFARIRQGTSENAETLIKRGVVHSNIFAGDMADMSKIARQLAAGDQGGWSKFIAYWDKTAMQADATTRLQIYEDAIKRGASEMEAVMAARESMNFNKRGMSPAVQYATRMIPFFNAQIQGLNVLLKAATGKASAQERLQIREKFFRRAMMLAGTTLLYSLAMDDDDTYKNAKPADRYGNWFIPNPTGGEHIRVPIPFEVGVLFKAIPEAMVDAIKGDFDEQSWKALKQLLISQIPGAGNMFVVPQLAKPVLEVYNNKNWYSGNPIESAADLRVEPQERFGRNTSEMAKWLSGIMQDAPADALKLSPKQIEHLVNGYLGGLPLAVARATNAVFDDPAYTRPEPKGSQMPLVGGLFQPQYGGAAMDRMYAQSLALEQAKGTYDKYISEGRVAEARKFLQDNVNVLGSEKIASNFTQAMAKFKQIETVYRTQIKDPEVLAQKLQELDAKRDEQAKMYLKAIQSIAK